MSRSTRGAKNKAVTRKLTISNRLGLHARAAAKFVRTAERFEAEIKVTREGLTVSGTSIMGLMALAAMPGSEIRLEARGAEARQAVEAIIRLVEAKFEED